MYNGEVSIAQDQLNSFLAVAEDLQVKGLTQKNSSSDTVSEPKPRSFKSDPIKPKPASSYKAARVEDDDIQEIVPVKQEISQPAPSIHQVEEYHNQEEYIGGYDDSYME